MGQKGQPQSRKKDRGETVSEAGERQKKVGVTGCKKTACKDIDAEERSDNRGRWQKNRRLAGEQADGNRNDRGDEDRKKSYRQRNHLQ